MKYHAVTTADAPPCRGHGSVEVVLTPHPTRMRMASGRQHVVRSILVLPNPMYACDSLVASFGASKSLPSSRFARLKNCSSLTLTVSLHIPLQSFEICPSAATNPVALSLQAVSGWEYSHITTQASRNGLLLQGLEWLLNEQQHHCKGPWMASCRHVQWLAI